MIHPLADVRTKNIGTNTKVWQFCVILPDAVIGDNCNINCHVLIEDDVIIGNGVTIKPCVQIWDGITIENNVFIGPNVTFTNDLNPRSKQYPAKFIKTCIGKGASIGANATILAGCHIGEFAVIGAGSVITKEIPPFSLWYGNPARQRGFVTRKGLILDMELKDKKGIQYIMKQDEPVKHD
jgi:acetyltransferase-like isoleucine patch superfamily enzyme